MTQPLRKTDGELLAQFCTDHSQPPFAELVNRHGAMVHGVALRVLADHHEAQDVMPAVFLALRPQSLSAAAVGVGRRLVAHGRLAGRHGCPALPTQPAPMGGNGHA